MAENPTGAMEGNKALHTPEEIDALITETCSVDTILTYHTEYVSDSRLAYLQSEWEGYVRSEEVLPQLELLFSRFDLDQVFDAFLGTALEAVARRASIEHYMDNAVEGEDFQRGYQGEREYAIGVSVHPFPYLNGEIDGYISVNWLGESKLTMDTFRARGLAISLTSAADEVDEALEALG